MIYLNRHCKIHVVVPNANYDHHYTIRFAFDANVKAVGGDNGVVATKNNDQAKTDTHVKEEKTKVESKETAKEVNKETKMKMEKLKNR